MRLKHFGCIFMLCLLFYTQCGNPRQEKPQLAATPEMFGTFFHQFSHDSVFQRQRIAFPLSVYESDIDDTQIQRVIQPQEWRFEYFSKDSATARRETDAFNVNYREQPPFHIYTRQGIDNGIHIDYYFEKREEQWYLVKIEDKST